MLLVENLDKQSCLCGKLPLIAALGVRAALVFCTTVAQRLAGMHLGAEGQGEGQAHEQWTTTPCHCHVSRVRVCRPGWLGQEGGRRAEQSAEPSWEKAVVKRRRLTTLRLLGFFFQILKWIHLDSIKITKAFGAFSSFRGNIVSLFQSSKLISCIKDASYWFLPLIFPGY